MKIGIDCRLWNETGVGRYIRNLVTELASIDFKNQYTLFFRKDEFETVPLPGKNFQKRLADVAWHSFKEQFELKKILEKETLDVVHFPYFSYPIGYKRKFVITIHDLIIDHFPTGKASTLSSPFYFLKQLGYRVVLKNALSKAQKIITVSGATKQEILDHYHPDASKVIVTYEGIDKNISFSTKEKIDVPETFFFSVGNAYPHKNLERLVDAFEIFHKKNPECKYIFVGRQDYFSKRLEKYVQEKKLENAILFYHHVSDKQLAFLYAKAKAVVIPSLMEGFGLPALEAMANSCLVLCSEIPAFLEVCGHVPVYFDPYNKEDIARKMELAYKHKITEILDRKEKGVKRAKQFSWKEMAKQTLDIYQNC